MKRKHQNNLKICLKSTCKTMLQNENTALHHPNTGLDTISKALAKNVFAYSRVLEPMPVLELVPELDPVLELEVFARAQARARA